MTLSLHDHLSEAGVDKWIAEIGCTNAPIPRENIKTALAFFSRDMPRLPIDQAVGFLAAMDLSRPVREVTLRPGDRLLGFRTESESPFKLFFARRGASAEQSGINTARRGPVHFVVRQEVRALESFTTGAKDFWTAMVPGQALGFAIRALRAQRSEDREFAAIVMGGGQQLIVPESYSSLLVEQR